MRVFAKKWADGGESADYLEFITYVQTNIMRGFMKRVITVCSVAILALLLAIGWNLGKEDSAEQERSPIDQIGAAACAKFEFCGAQDSGVLITSEIKALSNTFLSLDLVACDKPVSTWLYRITFNFEEIYLGNHEIVVLIGTDAMSIDGEGYCTPEGVPFDRVVEIFAAKYAYFADATE